MATPKRRHSNRRQGLRRSHDGLKVRSVSKCQNCGAPVLPHRICGACGFYRGKQVISIKVKEDKKA